MPESIHIPGALVNLFLNRHHLGWLVYVKEDGEVTKGELDLLDSIGDIVRLWVTHYGTKLNMSGKSGVFLDILEGNYDSREDIRKRLHVIGWSEIGHYLIFSFSPAPGAVGEDVMKKHLQKLFRQGILLSWKQNLYLLKQPAAVPQALFSLIKDAGWYGSVSGPYFDVFALKQ